MLPTVVAQTSNPPLDERILVAVAGPLVTVLIGGLVVWSITTAIERRRNSAESKRKEDREDEIRMREETRADLIRIQDRAKADDALRHELVTDMTKAAGSLYLVSQHYWRAKKDAEENPSDKALSDALHKRRQALDAKYLESRTSGEVLENRLEGYFISQEPREHWHQVMDLLTVRYFHLVGRATDKLYEANERKEDASHSGLSAAQLSDPKLVLKTYHEALKKAVRSVFDEKLRERSGS